MGLGAQRGTTAALVTFALWCKRRGYAVGEMHGFSTVHNVHTKGSWHYDQDGGFGKAADINVPGGGANERAHLAAAVPVAQSLGLAVIFGRDGKNGVTASHQGHLHADVGAYTNLGRGEVATPSGGDRVTEGIQRAVRSGADQVWGADTDQRVLAVRASTRFHGGQFPHGVAYTQGVVGATPDNAWGPRSSAAHDQTVAAIQRALGVTDDGIWGQGTESAFLSARDVRLRR